MTTKCGIKGIENIDKNKTIDDKPACHENRKDKIEKDSSGSSN